MRKKKKFAHQVVVLTPTDLGNFQSIMVGALVGFSPPFNVNSSTRLWVLKTDQKLTNKMKTRKKIKNDVLAIHTHTKHLLKMTLSVITSLSLTPSLSLSLSHLGQFVVIFIVPLWFIFWFYQVNIDFPINWPISSKSVHT